MTMRNFVLGGVGLVTYDDAITWNRKTPITYTSVDKIRFLQSAFAGVPLIFDDDGQFIVAGFAEGDVIKVVGSTYNDGFYIVDYVGTNALGLRLSPELVADEDASPGTVTISTPAQCPIDYI